MSVSAFPYGSIASNNVISVSVSASNVYANVTDFGSSSRVPVSGSQGGTNTQVNNGVGPFTYSWTKQTDAQGDAFTISSSTALNPGWFGTNRQSIYFDNIETWKITVTDEGDGDNTAEDIINVELEFISLD